MQVALVATAIDVAKPMGSPPSIRLKLTGELTCDGVVAMSNGAVVVATEEAVGREIAKVANGAAIVAACVALGEVFVMSDGAVVVVVAADVAVGKEVASDGALADAAGVAFVGIAIGDGAEVVPAGMAVNRILSPVSSVRVQTLGSKVRMRS